MLGGGGPESDTLPQGRLPHATVLCSWPTHPLTAAIGCPGAFEDVAEGLGHVDGGLPLPSPPQHHARAENGERAVKHVSACREEDDAAVGALVGGLHGGLQRRAVVVSTVALSTKALDVEAGRGVGDGSPALCSQEGRRGCRWRGSKEAAAVMCAAECRHMQMFPS